jgi:hypothetical protein
MGPDMGRNLRRVGWITVLCGGTLLGCHKSAVQHKEPPDPLLVTKPAVAGKSHSSNAGPLARSEPTPPPAPPAAADTPTSVRRDYFAPVRPARLQAPSPE